MSGKRNVPYSSADHLRAIGVMIFFRSLFLPPQGGKMIFRPEQVKGMTGLRLDYRSLFTEEKDQLVWEQSRTN
jgi:hypothetical protein